MSAIPAVSRTIKTMADGTLRLTVDIEPTHAQDAFALFGSGNVPMALAALKVGVTVQEPEPELKGGELAKLAGQLIRNPEFWVWISARQITSGRIACAADADLWLKRVCAFDSKRELDHEPQIAERFHRLVRIPFVEWQQKQGRAAA